MKRVRDEQGSSIVEFAMGASILFSVIFGVMAICLAIYSYNVTAELAREATRYAIVRGTSCNSFSDCNVTKAQLQTHVQSIGFPGINPANLTLTAPTGWSAYPAGSICQPSAACNNPGNLVTVTVTYQFPLVIPFVPSRTLSMSSTASMVISQ